jgi:hypothetical protein
VRDGRIGSKHRSCCQPTLNETNMMSSSSFGGSPFGVNLVDNRRSFERSGTCDMGSAVCRRVGVVYVSAPELKMS